MPTGVSWKKDERRQHRAVLKYKKVEGDKWSIDTSKDRGAVRPIDLVSRDPDRLREHVTIEAAVAFEEECYKEAERLKAIGCDWSQYRYIPRRQLNILEDQPHDWSKLRGTWYCTRCFKRSGAVKPSASQGCRGYPMASCVAEIGKEKAWVNEHSVWLTGPYVWCSRCAAYGSSRKMKLLRKKCRAPLEEKLSGTYTFIRKRLAMGCAPTRNIATSVWIGQPSRFTFRSWLEYQAEQDGKILSHEDAEEYIEDLRRLAAEASTCSFQERELADLLQEGEDLEAPRSDSD